MNIRALQVYVYATSRVRAYSGVAWWTGELYDGSTHATRTRSANNSACAHGTNQQHEGNFAAVADPDSDSRHLSRAVRMFYPDSDSRHLSRAVRMFYFLLNTAWVGFLRTGCTPYQQHHRARWTARAACEMEPSPRQRQPTTHYKSNWRCKPTSEFEMCFAIGSQHRWVLGVNGPNQNTDRIQYIKT